MHKSVERTPPRRENSFRLHYFPEIPIDGSDEIRSGQAQVGSFQRVHYSAKSSSPDGDSVNTAAPNRSGLSERQIKEIETRAYMQGFNKGESDGFAAAERKTHKALAHLSTLLNELTALRKQIYSETEAEVIELVLAVVRKVVCAEAQTNPEIIAGVLSEALRKVESQQQLRVRMHPQDIEFLERNRLKLSAALEDTESVKLESDPLIGRGGCLIETESGSIDARLEKQLQVIEHLFRSQNQHRSE